LKILSFDISKTKTGWALWDVAFRNGVLPDMRGISGMRTGSFKTEGDTLFEAVASFQPQFVRVVKECNPDFASYEEGLPNIKSYVGEGGKESVNSSALVLNRLLGSAQGVLMGLKTPHESVPDQTWRKAFLGFGRKTGFSKADYKRAAKAMCDELGIDAKNQDEAEAAGVCFWTAFHSQHLKNMISEVAA